MMSTARFPKISCLTPTQDRLDLLRQAVDSYCRQTWPNRELVIAAHGGEELRQRIEAYVKGLRRADVRLVRLESGVQTLGSIRNALMDAACGEIVCPWDDDDLSHPDRLRVQAETLLGHGAIACLMTDHLQWFRETGELYWVDWRRSREELRFDYLPGTLMMFRDDTFRYPESGSLASVGEDSVLLEQLLAANSVAALKNQGYLYVYTYHGANTYPLSHHRLIAQAAAHDAQSLPIDSRQLCRHLEAYGFSLPPVLLSAQGTPIIGYQ